ncbi:hypothetical protein [Pseudotenacibaculum haliotis]|uniref:DUF4833 domain-containing protein n=1 Tax=Pseudotenacibaculum haliotis TaxID=1862138 RepID=A0ABW5LR88_9FLAO
MDPRKTIIIVLLTLVTNVLFAQVANHNDTISSTQHKLNLEYNVMTNITLEKPKRYNNKKRYKYIKDGVYLDLKEKKSFKYRMTISYKQKADKPNSQYPLEDILDKYLLYVSHEFKARKHRFKIELGGDLDNILKAKKELIGKKVFNRDYVGEDGKVYTKLVIE